MCCPLSARISGEAAALIDEDGAYIPPEEKEETEEGPEEAPEEDTVSEDSIEDTSEEAVQEDNDKTGEIVDTEAPSESRGDWETGGGI